MCFIDLYTCTNYMCYVLTCLANFMLIMLLKKMVISNQLSQEYYKHITKARHGNIFQTMPWSPYFTGLSVNSCGQWGTLELNDTSSWCYELIISTVHET